MPFIEVEGARILFIHIPKTGGTAIEAWMESLAPIAFKTTGRPRFSFVTPQHYRWSDIAELFPEGHFAHRFAVVRNPYDRIASEYRMHAIMAREGFFRSAPSFSLWLEEALDAWRADPWTHDNHLRPQWEFVDKGVRIFHYERGLDWIVASMAEIAGLAAPETVERRLTSEAFEGEIAWSETDLIRVQETYGRDFARFGYDPEAGPGAPPVG